MNSVRIQIPGVPTPQGRPRFFMRGRHPQVYDPNKKDKDLVKSIISSQVSMLSDVPLIVDIIFYMPIPKSTTKKKRLEMLSTKYPHTKKPDIDNLAKFVLDCMNGLVFRDDSLVCKLNCFKMYSGNPRTEIEALFYS